MSPYDCSIILEYDVLSVVRELGENDHYNPMRVSKLYWDGTLACEDQLVAS